MIVRAVAACLALTVAAVLAATPARAASLKQVEVGSAPNATTFLLSGVFVGGESAKLQAEVAKQPPGQRIAVILDSPGGLVAEGLKLGRFFYEARIATLVFAGGIGCHSACSLAFLGGRDAASGKRLRVMMSGARLGFHQFSAKFDPNRSYTRQDMGVAVENAHRVMDAIIAYLRGIDEDLGFLTLMLRAPHESIALLGEEAALERGIHIVGRNPMSLTNLNNNKRRLASQ